VECGFDATGAAHIQSILTYMYRDAPLAALREYATNALDAHVRAGNPDPIEVALPTAWEPTLTVADHGVGLSEQDIITVYSPYGTSTKRGTNTEVGAFGIGAKAAFAVSPQFTVTGVKDGVKVNALFALNEDGVATVEIVNRATTAEPDGVTVKVPVDDPAAMRQAADRLFGYWRPGTVVVDGKQPTYCPMGCCGSPTRSMPTTVAAR
jgi:DNA topoisomerase VI subunit B